MTDTLITVNKYDDLGTNVNKNTLGEAQIVKMYDEVPAKPSTPLEAVTQAAVQDNQEVKEEKTETEVSRRDSLKRISERERKANEKEKLANEKLAKAEQFHDSFKKFEEDPTLLAKAMGMETSEFLRKLQNKVFDIKEEPVKSVKQEDAIQQRFDQLEQQTKRLAEENFKSQKNTYISQHILPVLAKDPERFAELNAKIESSASYIHDLVHNHWLETGGREGKQGEIWSTEQVAEELEAELVAEKEKAIEELKKSPKLKKYFKDEVEVEQVSTKPAPVKTITSSLGSNASGGLPELPSRNQDGTKIVYNTVSDPREARRLRTAAAIKAQFPDRFTKTNKK